MTAVVLVGMSIRDAGERDALQRRANQQGATLAFLQHGDPALVTELTRLADAGTTRIRLELVTSGGASPGRSWLRRVAGTGSAGHDRPSILIGDTEVSGREAGLSSPAWQDVPGHAHHLLVCRGPRCSARGADDTATAIDAALAGAGLGDDDVLVTQTGCLFPCNQAPVVVEYPGDVWFGSVDTDGAKRIVTEYLAGTDPMDDLRLDPGR